jgi:dTDP-4-amino-4,6-dideoxygalactose transaminase
MPECSLPEAERYARENLALPMFAELANSEVEYVISVVKEFFSNRD